MPRPAIYKTDGGAINRFVCCPYSLIQDQCGDGEEFYLNCPDTATHIIDNEPVTIVPEVVPPTLGEVKAAKLAELASARYTEEVGGIVVGGVTIATDRESQSMLTGAYVSLKQGLMQSVNWKGDDGWVTATLTEIEPIAQAVGQHIAVKQVVAQNQAGRLSGQKVAGQNKSLSQTFGAGLLNVG